MEEKKIVEFYKNLLTAGTPKKEAALLTCDNFSKTKWQDVFNVLCYYETRMVG